MFIATVIAADRLSGGDISAAADAARDAGHAPCGSRWIEPGSAFDLDFDAPPGADLLEGAIAGADVVVQPAALRRRRLLVADMDSTMIEVECIDELADYAGIRAEVAAITERAMRGELDFERALDARVSLLAGLDAETIDRCRDERVRIARGARTLVRTMKARGATSILVSGGFTRFAEAVADEIGFDRVVANILEIEEGRLTGRVVRPLVGAKAKCRALLDAAAELGVPIEATLAVGDGANDIPMLRAAGLGVAYKAKPAAAAVADARIEHNDLAALLYAQGYARSDWAATH